MRKPTCPHCDTQFETGYPDKIYCSEKCGSAAARERRRQRQGKPPARLHRGECADCGMAFVGKQNTRKYCSSRCQRRAHDRRRDARRRGRQRASTTTKREAIAAIERRADGALELLREVGLVEIVDGCWVWQGALQSGYAVYGGRRMHRLIAEYVHGDLCGETVHHTCANRRCVNPDHLQPVSNRENIAEMLQRNYYLARIADLEVALAEWAPLHPLLTASKGRHAC